MGNGKLPLLIVFTKEKYNLNMKTKAAVLYQMGAPAPYAENVPLVIDELTLTAPGHGELLIEIVSAGLCHSDLSVIDGSRPRVMPMVMGHEASGIVRETGEGVTEFAVGDHVVFSFVPVCGHCIYCASGRSALCEKGAKANIAGTLLSGSRHFTDSHGQTCHHHLGVSAFSQFTVAAQESLVKIDPDIALDTAALFGCAVLTGVGAVVNTARVEPGTCRRGFWHGRRRLEYRDGRVGGRRVSGDRGGCAADDKLALANEVGATHTCQCGKLDNPVAGDPRDHPGRGTEYVL